MFTLFSRFLTTHIPLIYNHLHFIDHLHSETLKYTHFYDMKMGVFQCLRVYFQLRLVSNLKYSIFLPSLVSYSIIFVFSAKFLGCMLIFLAKFSSVYAYSRVYAY